MDNFYSKHIFIASFKLENNSRDIIPDDVWKEDFIDDVNTVEELVDNYANNNYFNKQAQDLIFNYEIGKQDERDSKVVNYKFSRIDSSGKSKYKIIVKKDNDKVVDNEEDDSKMNNYQKSNYQKHNKYELNLDKIILKKYEIENEKIFLMMIYVTNNDYERLSDIKNINQYGRRLYSPWIPLDLGNGVNTECPDDLQIHIGDEVIYSNDSNDENNGKADLNYKDKEIFKYNFDDKSEFKLNEIRQNKSIIKNPHKSNLIQNILNYKKKLEDEKIKIELINPDRMYVGFYVKNVLIESIKKYSTRRQEYAYLYDDNLSNQLYALAYIDRENATCQSRVMRKKLLQETIYDRWIDCGTIHTVTHNGFGCIATDGAPYESVIMPFLTEYMEMMALVLLQRNLLLGFHIRAKELSPEFNSEKLENLQKDYVKFKTQVLLFEVTPQEQGYEIYRLMQKQLYIDEEKEKLDDIMNSLYEVANIEHSIKLNKKIRCLTIIGVIVAIISLIISFEPVKNFIICLVCNIINLK